MSHELTLLSAQLYNTPLLIEQGAFEGILKYLEARNSGNYNPELRRGESEDYESDGPAYNEDTKTGVVNITGPLTAKPVTIMGFDCGGTSYQGLKADFEDLAARGAKTIVMMVDSPGGMAYGCFDAANYMRQIATDNGIKIISYVEQLSASAGYALTAISDEIIVNSQSTLGSIGVLVELINDSGALEKEGYKRTFISAGKNKIPIDDNGEFKKEFIEDIQSKVDVSYKEFVEHVAAYRDLSVESVIATQAKTFLSGKAIELGLADRSMTLEEFYDYVAEQATPQPEEKMFKRPSKLVKLENTEGNPEMNLAELQTQVAELTSQLGTSATELSASQAALATLQSTLSEKDVALSALVEQVTALEAEKSATKLSARKTALSAVLAADKVDSTLTALSALDDNSFDTVLSSYKAQAVVNKESDLMQELGGEGAVVIKAENDKEDKAATATRAALAKQLGLKA